MIRGVIIAALLAVASSASAQNNPPPQTSSPGVGGSGMTGGRGGYLGPCGAGKCVTAGPAVDYDESYRPRVAPRYCDAYGNCVPSKDGGR